MTILVKPMGKLLPSSKKRILLTSHAPSVSSKPMAANASFLVLGSGWRVHWDLLSEIHRGCSRGELVVVVSGVSIISTNLQAQRPWLN